MNLTLCPNDLFYLIICSLSFAVLFKQEITVEFSKKNYGGYTYFYRKVLRIESMLYSVSQKVCIHSGKDRKSAMSSRAKGPGLKSGAKANLII